MPTVHYAECITESVAELLATGLHLVTRLHPQALVVVEEDRLIQSVVPVPDTNAITGTTPDADVRAPAATGTDDRPPLVETMPIRIVSDQRITLGSPNNRGGAVLEHMRLVTAIVAPEARAANAKRGAEPVTYQIVTDRFDLSAIEVIALYRYRWQIELFFRWLKTHLHLPRLLGYSRNAVELSVALGVPAAHQHCSRSSLGARLAWTG